MSQIPRVFTEAYAPDKLIAGLTQVVSWQGTLAAGQNLRRGAVVGRISATGKLVLSTAAATDGSQTPYGILVDDYDATTADQIGVSAYVKGEFNENAVILGAGHSVASVREGLRDQGVYLVSTSVA